jgi:hypothetical protein
MLGDFLQLTLGNTGAAACTSATTSVLGAWGAIANVSDRSVGLPTEKKMGGIEISRLSLEKGGQKQRDKEQAMRCYYIANAGGDMVQPGRSCRLHALPVNGTD